MIQAGSLTVRETVRLLIRLWHHLRRRRKRQFIAVTSLMLLSAFAEVATLGAVIPFITVLVNPDRVMQYEVVATLARFIGVVQPEDLIVPLALVFVAGAVFSALVRLVVVWATTHLSIVLGADLTVEAYERTLYQPYATHVKRNTSEVTSGVIHKVEAVVSGMFFPLQVAVGSVFTFVSVTIALFVIAPRVAAIAVGFFLGAYAIITRVFRGRLERNSQRIAQEQTRVLKAIQEGIGGIRDVLIDGTQAVFVDQFRRSDREVRRAQGSNSVITQSPRLIMEGLAMTLIVVLAVALNSRSGGITDELPVLAALVLGAQRLLPIFQQCYSAVTTVLGNRAVLTQALEMLDQPMPMSYGLHALRPSGLREELRFEGVRFRYSDDGPWVIDQLDMVVPVGSRIGLVGTTGCGKTTLLDLLMGLLRPVEGEITVDGQVLEGERLQTWQRAIVHVPQHIFLADVSVTENIAFGVTRDDIDMDRVVDAANQAKIADFIEKELLSYEAVVGERGIRLSGGQRQRIGIARALYKQASVLVLDEATSALDNTTERSVMSSLAAHDRHLTVILVAHRLSTLKDCDVIYEMSEGRIIGQGTFDGLMAISATFREMAVGTEDSIHDGWPHG